MRGVFSGRAGAEGKVKVFILTGQSNMQGHATVACLEYQATKGKYRDQDADALTAEWNPPGKQASKEEKRKYMAQWRAKCLVVGRSNAGHHYLDSPKTMCPIGKAFGEAKIGLQQAK